MQAAEQLEELKQSPGDFRASSSPARRNHMEARPHCAYNRTRECFLGLEVAVADLASAALAERMQSLAFKSGEGLWIAPFRGLPAVTLHAPLDLIYLDERGGVLDVVESFPTFKVSASCPSPASVLVLPAHSIYSSQTQAGDQLIVCAAEEMEAFLNLLDSGKTNITVQSAALLREEPLWSGGPGTVEFETAAPKSRAQEQLHEMTLVKPTARNVRTPKNWLERWWSPDPRKAPREPSPGLAAYYWNGSAPEAHGIRDISSSGLYVVTEERWYPGTLVLMTLQRTDCGEELAERSISVLSRAVRWGQDGVGLQFILGDPRGTRKNGAPVMDTVERKELDKFLEQLKKGK